jgi:hypothetical protein
VVHLTRDDRGDDSNGETAIANFRAILDQQRILAVRPHCLHHRRVEQLDRKQQEYFRVACFTETPLDQLSKLTNQIEGRSHNLEPFGFVFRKELLLSRGAQPAVYINGYGGANDYRKAFDQIFSIAVRTGFTGRSWRVLPFVNAMHGGCDFAWEREWRLARDFAFELADLVCVILPESRYGPLKFNLNRRGIAVISPNWTYEQIVDELSAQKRSTRRLSVVNE